METVQEKLDRWESVLGVKTSIKERRNGIYDLTAGDDTYELIIREKGVWDLLHKGTLVSRLYGEFSKIQWGARLEILDHSTDGYRRYCGTCDMELHDHEVLECTRCKIVYHSSYPPTGRDDEDYPLFDLAEHVKGVAKSLFDIVPGKKRLQEIEEWVMADIKEESPDIEFEYWREFDFVSRAIEFCKGD